MKHIRLIRHHDLHVWANAYQRLGEVSAPTELLRCPCVKSPAIVLEIPHFDIFPTFFRERIFGFILRNTIVKNREFVWRQGEIVCVMLVSLYARTSRASQ